MQAVDCLSSMIYMQRRTLTPGTMVMLQDGKKLEFPGKFDAIWLGPYWIMDSYPNNTLQLATLDGTYFPTRTSVSTPD